MIGTVDIVLPLTASLLREGGYTLFVEAEMDSER